VTVATNLDYSSVPDDSAQHALPASRIAVYEDASFAPRIIDIPRTADQETIGALAATTHTQLSRLGGPFPYRIILEACENLIHANFEGVVISVLDQGCTVVISDQGPGINQPSFALNTGFTSATLEMKATIRGVGAGFTIMKEYLESIGGSMQLDSNIGSGSVLTLRTKPQFNYSSPTLPSHLDVIEEKTSYVPPATLNVRQKEVLAVFLKHEFVGPQLVVQILDVSLATAHRDLEMLEKSGLVERTKNRKRTLTQTGFDYVDYLSAL
jgi:hypothetical protein